MLSNSSSFQLIFKFVLIFFFKFFLNTLYAFSHVPNIHFVSFDDVLFLRKCAVISARYGLSEVFDNLVISLCKFTTLLSQGEVCIASFFGFILLLFMIRPVIIFFVNRYF